jgi:hypothetical protein
MRCKEKTSNIMSVENVISGPTGMCEQHPRITRRQLLRTGAVIGLTVSTTGCSWWRNAPLAGGQIEQTQAINMRLGGSDLVVQPVLTYDGLRRRRRHVSAKS